MEVGPESDQRVMSIVGMALRQAAAERDSYVRLACQGDPDLYREVSEIVAGEARMGSFLLHPILPFNELQRPFQPGQLVAQRFEILHEIGEGGMGVVYEAFDRKRRIRIAIKSAKPGFQRLLSPELEGALTVRHPNVCRANEIHTAWTEHGEVDFLTLELLEGETLLARLKARGRLAETEALQIARQLCAGLAEAHRCGVIHRDLKSANIFLCSDPNGQPRAVITDFGLAGGMPEPNRFGGTPDYMAPELWEGQYTSGASDIYALGVILYEMVAGRRPFEGEWAEDGVAGRPAAPSTLIPTLHSRWDRPILRCLAASPDARPTDAMDVLSELESRHAPRTLLVTVPLLLLALLVAALSSPQVRNRIWPPPAVRLAVLPAIPAADETEDVAEPVLEDVADRVGHMRAAGRAVASVSPLELRALQVRTPQQARQALGATHALQTTMRRDGSQFDVRIAVIDLDTQVHLRDFSASYTRATLGMVPAALAGEVSLALRLQSPRVAETLSSTAVQSYDRGVYLLRQDAQNYPEAIRLFQQAVRLDTRSALPWAALAEAQIAKFKALKDHGALTDAQESLRNAESLNPDSVKVRLVAGLLHKAAGQYEAALDDYHRAQELEPRNPDALMRLAGMYDALNEPDKAIEHYRKAIALEPGDYHPYQELGAFYYYRGNYAQAAVWFKQAIGRAPGLYEAYSSLGAALNYLGRDEEAEEALMTSLKLKETARAFNSLGALRAYRGQDAQAAEYYERAVRINPRNTIYLLNLGDSYRRSGRLAAAASAYRTAMELTLAELNADARNGLTRAYVAYFAARLGDARRAEEEIGQALGLAPGDSMVMRKAVLTYAALGETDRAIEILRRAPAEVVRELDRHPDLADLRRNLRFQQVVGTTQGGGT
jgi:tetratricopeptide (TPR) repeat protein